MRSSGASSSCPTTSEPDGSAAIVNGSFTSGSRCTSTATDPSRVVRLPNETAMRQLPATGKRSVAWYRPRRFVARSGTAIVFGPATRSVARAGGDTETTARQTTPLTAWRGTETPWTLGAGAPPSATTKRSERALITIRRFRRIYGGFATLCQVPAPGDPRTPFRGPARAGGLVGARARGCDRRRRLAGARAGRGAGRPALRGQPRVRRPRPRAAGRRRGRADPARLGRRVPRHRPAALARGRGRRGGRRARRRGRDVHRHGAPPVTRPRGDAARVRGVRGDGRGRDGAARPRARAALRALRGCDPPPRRHARDRRGQRRGGRLGPAPAGRARRLQGGDRHAQGNRAAVEEGGLRGRRGVDRPRFVTAIGEP